MGNRLINLLSFSPYLLALFGLWILVRPLLSMTLQLRFAAARLLSSFGIAISDQSPFLVLLQLVLVLLGCFAIGSLANAASKAVGQILNAKDQGRKKD